MVHQSSSFMESRSFRLRSPSLNSIRLRRIFDIFDKNGDCIITVDELGQALSLLGLLPEDFGQLESMVQAHIQPGSSGLRYEDFEALHTSLNHSLFSFGNDVQELGLGLESESESDLQEAFKVFDEDGDGYICARELQTVLGKLGLLEMKGREMEMDEIEMMISSVDEDDDGRVNFLEFKHMMRNVCKDS